MCVCVAHRHSSLNDAAAAEVGDNSLVQGGSSSFQREG